MSFSFRTMFPNSHEAAQQAGSAVMEPAGTSPAVLPSAIMQAALPLNAVSPFGGPLFKASPGEQAVASPVAGSPFSVSSAGPANVPLTVGDVMPQLPPELARAGALPLEHPVALSGQVIDEALRSGRAAVPVFEIYRVCPALFQTPVSPQDPRMVPLPAAKLPHLIAASRGGAAEMPVSVPPSSVKTSPFMMAAMPSEQAVAAPSAPSEASAGAGMLLPPKRQGPPPALADVGKMISPDVTLPGTVHGTAAAFPMSPFAVGAGANPPVQTATTVSPFAVPTAEPAPAQPQRPVEQAASPFQTAPVPASPFAAASPSRQEVSPPQAADSPFAAVFGGKALPVSPPGMEVQPSPAPSALSSQPSADPGLPSFGAAAPVASPAMGGGMVRIALASLLKGYSVAELGFDPMVVPGWITTALPSHVARDLSLASTPLVELGLLVDGITDVGFRNVLNTAKRDFQMRVDPGVLQQALAGNNLPASLPSLTNLGTGSLNAASKPAPSFAAPPGGAMRIEPSAPPTSFTPPQPSMPLAAAAPSAPVPLMTESEAPSPFLVPAVASKPLMAPAAKDPFSVPAATATSPFTGGMGMPAAARQQDFMAGSPPPQESSVPFQVPSLLTPVPGGSLQESDAGRPSGDGFGSDQLLGRAFSSTSSWNETAVSSVMGESPVFPPAKEAPLREHTPPKPFLDEPAEPECGWTATPATRPFSPPKFDDSLPPVPVDEEPPPPPRKPSPPPLPRASASGSGSSVGVQAHDADPDQIVLRALLDTDSDLEPQKVVELTCRLPGIAACVCLHEGRAISHVGAHKPQAREFQKQATQLAQHLKTLAPLIGIDGAETFTMNSGDRLMTFCFPDRAILGVLHDAEPTLGLRDKITLIARELSRMVS
jgi:hypothetical protein